MPARTITTDAVVVGAGTAGAATAYQLARRGLRVVLVEQRAAGRAGARWHNGVLDRHFVRAGIAPPSGPERFSDGGAVHLEGPDGSRGPTVAPSPTVTANMVLLGDRLRTMACEAGVEVIDRADTVDVSTSARRVMGLEVRSARLDARSAGAEDAPAPARERSVHLTLEAPLFVDASGRRGVLRRHSPVLARWCPPVRGDELCSAADHHLRVVDRDGAHRFLDRHGARPGESVTVVGMAGGFSTRAITVSPDIEEVSVLVGCLANGRHGTGPRLLDEARADEPWIGASTMGGFGVIPLRRPYARFTAPGLALVGDAASQVFPAHGSGIGIGLVAGRILADTVAEAVAAGEDHGSEHVLWRYQAAFHDELGPDLLGFDALRRMSTALGSDGVAAMVRTGVMGEEMARAGLDQRWAVPPASELPDTVARLAREPRLAAVMVPYLARAQVARMLGARHPAEPDEAALARWDRRVRRVLGPMPS